MFENQKCSKSVIHLKKLGKENYFKPKYVEGRKMKIRAEINNIENKIIISEKSNKSRNYFFKHFIISF